MRSLWTAAWIVGVISSQSAWAWGNVGHQVTGAIASKHLCAQSERATQELLDGETLADASTWADEIRDDPMARPFKTWHYVNIERGSNYSSSPHSDRGDVVTAIENQINRLRSHDRQERQQALKLLVHFIADAHQPFHAGSAHDHGGNAVRVNWFGRPRTLHSIWDSGMIRVLRMNYNQIADLIERGAPGFPPVAQETPEVWVDESARLTLNAYPNERDSREPRLGYEYHQRHIETVKRRLRDSGLRLARILNEQFGCETRPIVELVH